MDYNSLLLCLSTLLFLTTFIFPSLHFNTNICTFLRFEKRLTTLEQTALTICTDSTFKFYIL